MSDFMKSPCIHCPFRRDVKPFLRPERGAELAYHAQNPYNSFSCHKTTEPMYNALTEQEEMFSTESSKECAGFITLQCQEGMEPPKGFTPAWDLVYTDVYEMIDAYENK